jgi:hypothetical protein
MRNLKKFLALALAVMMTLSLMVTANAYTITTSAVVTDKDSITAEFQEAVAVLNGLGIITGYEDGTFRPSKSISRQETTALIYRLHSGDVKDTKNDLYSTADNIKQFTDVNREGGQKWSAGYIGYCANQGIIKGVSDTRFAPTHEVTGYQVLAMVLRAIGYGQNKEYEGDGWQTRVATTATQLGILKNVNNTNYAATLSGSATRELVAEIVFQAALQDTVTYTAGLGYVKTGSTSLVGGTLGSLSTKNFDLKPGDFQVIDEWGRPGYKWYSGSNPVATIKVNYAKAYDTTTRECDVAHDLKIDTSAKYRLFVNSDEFITDNYLIVATDTVTKVGGQGRITEFYDELHHPHKNNTWPASVVMIDTFLGKVTKVEDRVLDAKEHVMIPARLYVNVYDSVTNTEAGGTPVVLEKSDANWAFAKGDFITLNAYTNHDEGIDANDVKSVHTGAESNKNEAAFEAEKVLLKSGSKTPEYYANVAKVEPVLGKQTTIYWNQGKHNVDNVDKLDQLDLHLDVAGTTTDTTFAWYYDAKGNLIGIGNVPNTINYGIITSIYSAFKQGDGNTTGEAVARAHVKYADGTEADITIDKFYVNSNKVNTAAAAGHITAGTTMTDNTTNAAISNSAAGTAELLPIYDNGAQNAMSASERTVTGPIAHGTQTGWLHVAPVSNVNASAEAAASTDATPWGQSVAAGGTTIGSYGIIKGNLFKFVSSSDGNMTAIEVAGGANNTGIYDNHYNDATTAKSELSKNYSYLTVDTTTIRMDNDTKIIVRGCKMDTDDDFTEATNTITVYDGIDELPASIIIPNGAEVDWADTDDNGIADVVYVYGVKKGATGYGLFYYNGGAGQWTGNAATGSGWLRGWLDGKETDLTFTNKDLFDRVQLSTVEYGGHLFAMKLLDGEVETLLGNDAITNGNMDYFLADTGSAVNGPFTPNSSGVALNATEVATLAEITVANGITGIAGNTTFTVGDLTVNDYTSSTKAVWLHDDGRKQNVDGTYTDVRYNANKNTIEAASYTVTNGTTATTFADADYATVYRLTGSSLILGDALHFLNIENRVNDVTIVFEDNADDAIRQVYVTTRPDITPPGGEGSSSGILSVTGDASVLGSNTTTPQDLANQIITGMRDTVLYSPYANNPTGMTGLASSENPENLLYFPYTGTAGSYTLRIKDAKGLVYTETANVSADGLDGGSSGDAHCFVFDIYGGTNTGTNKNPLRTGVAYTFEIISSSGTVVSTGTFTLS